MQRVAMLSVHTSPLALPGSGDAGGMNVYVHALVFALARAGVGVDALTRREHPEQPPVVVVEPGYRVDARRGGRCFPVPRHMFPELVAPFSEAARAQLERCGTDDDLLHANYWVSGAVGHRLKHEFDLPLVTTFHSLDETCGAGAELGFTLRSTGDRRRRGASARGVSRWAQCLDREVDALERLDPSDEQQHGMCVEAERAAGSHPIAGREQGAIDALRNDHDPLRIGAVVAHELLAFLVGCRDDEIGAPYDLGFDPGSQGDLVVEAGGGAHAVERVERGDERQIELVLEPVADRARYPVVGVQEVVVGATAFELRGGRLR